MKKLPIIAITLIYTVCMSCMRHKNTVHEDCSISDSTTILYNAFSHNDYSRPEPLQAALKLGFNCVEADCYLIDGEFRVGHDFPDDPETLPLLMDTYFKPLFARIDSIGAVYPGAERPFYLMIDIKREGDKFYSALQPFLAENSRYFTRVQGDSIIDGPILLFFSGSRPLETLPRESVRWAFLDGKFEDMDKVCPTSLYPVVSDNYEDFFTWNGVGEMPSQERDKLKQLIAKAHSQGRLFRLWGAPDTEAWARVQIAECVDLIGTDNLPSLHKLLTSCAD